MDSEKLEKLEQTWIILWHGGRIQPFICPPEEFQIEDIARGLSHICRYGGQTGWLYSVAQHCVLISRLCSPENARWGLLHDAAEAYVGDMRRPYKRVLPEFEFLESRVFRGIKKRFGLEGEQPEEVFVIDQRMVIPEARALHGVDPVRDGWEQGKYANPDNIYPVVERVTPDQAMEMFLERFYELYP